MLTVPVVDPMEIWGQPVRARLPGSDDDAVLIELQAALHEFLKHSLSLVYDVPLLMQEGVPEYSLNPVATEPDPLDAPWNGLHGLYCHYAVFGTDPRHIFPVDYKPLGASYSPSVPQRFWCPEPAVVELLPTPNSLYDGIAFTVTTSLVPIHPVMSVPKMVSDYYFESILDGTVGRMMSHVKRPYSDPKTGTYHMRRFRNGMRTAKDETLRRWSNAERSAVYNRDWSWKPQQRNSQ